MNNIEAYQYWMSLKDKYETLGRTSKSRFFKNLCRDNAMKCAYNALNGEKSIIGYHKYNPIH